jgi:hypothetical protein
VIDEKDLEQAERVFVSPERSFDRFLRRRDRKRRNRRIRAGVVGIAVFVAAVWIVTSGLSLDRIQKSVAPAGEVTGPAETAPPLSQASPEPNVFKHHCGHGAIVRLELTDLGDRIKVRFDVHDSPPGHLWRIRMWRNRNFNRHVEIWRGVRVASDSGDFAVIRLTRDINPGGLVGFGLKARDPVTGEVCQQGLSAH